MSWTSWATGPDQVRTQAQKDAFQKAYPAIKVDMQNVDYNGYWDKLTAGLAGGTAPDVYRVTPLNIADYALKGAAKLLDPLIAQAGKGAFTTSMYPNVVDAGKLGGKLYGVPHGADTCCLHINETLFKNAGIPLPPTDWTDPSWTWDSFIDVATRLTKFTTKASTGASQQQAVQMALQYGVAQTWWGIAGPLGSVITMNGGSMFDPTMKKVTLGEGPSVSAIQWAADLASKHHIIPATAAEKKQFTFDLKSGNEAMFWFYGSTEVVTLETAIAGNFDHNMYPVPHPTGQKPHAYFHQSYWLINQATKHPDEAWQFANFLGLPAGRIPELAVGFGLPMTADPAEAAAFLSKYPNLHKQVITQAVSLAVPWRFPLGYTKMDQTASEALTDDVMYLGKRSVSDALASVIPVLQNTLDTAKPS